MCPLEHTWCDLRAQRKTRMVIQATYSRGLVLLWEYANREAALGSREPTFAQVLVDTDGYLLSTVVARACTWHGGDRQLHTLVTGSRRHVRELTATYVVDTMPSVISRIPKQIRSNPFGRPTDRVSFLAASNGPNRPG
jgi:hypothetical protein